MCSRLIATATSSLHPARKIARLAKTSDFWLTGQNLHYSCTCFSICASIDASSTNLHTYSLFWILWIGLPVSIRAQSEQTNQVICCSFNTENCVSVCFRYLFLVRTTLCDHIDDDVTPCRNGADFGKQADSFSLTNAVECCC